MKQRHCLKTVLLFPLILSPGLFSQPVLAQAAEDAFESTQRSFTERIEAEGLAEPFRGITTDGEVTEGLYSIESTGVSTEPVRAAATAFIDTLSREQREATLFPLDDIEWRRWGNQHVYLREGLSFEAMSAPQRDAAIGLMQASLSAEGLTLARDIMRLNHTLAELNDHNFVEYGEWKYWITIMGTPSASEPWGWQLDGHHLILNYFVLGDQVVMTPAFWGSEPTVAESGQYEGVEIMEAEARKGLALMQSLGAEQQDRALIQAEKDGSNTVAEAFSDNIVLDHAGIPASELSGDQRDQLIDLIEQYVGNLREGHAEVRMSEVEAHLDDTYFAWIGGTGEEDVYYYRIHSPVILIEFDHQRPVGLTHLYPEGVPYRKHVHAVVRTPNGNDYGKDLLRQHHEQHAH